MWKSTLKLTGPSSVQHWQAQSMQPLCNLPLSNPTTKTPSRRSSSKNRLSPASNKKSTIKRISCLSSKTPETPMYLNFIDQINPRCPTVCSVTTTSTVLVRRISNRRQNTRACSPNWDYSILLAWDSFFYINMGSYMLISSLKTCLSVLNSSQKSTTLDSRILLRCVVPTTNLATLYHTQHPKYSIKGHSTRNMMSSVSVSPSSR